MYNKKKSYFLILIIIIRDKLTPLLFVLSSYWKKKHFDY